MTEQNQNRPAQIVYSSNGDLSSVESRIQKQGPQQTAVEILELRTRYPKLIRRKMPE